MSAFITLPTGEIVRRDTIIAVRIGNGINGQTPSVVIDYGVMGRMSTLMCSCESVQARDDLVAEIKRRIECDDEDGIWPADSILRESHVSDLRLPEGFKLPAIQSSEGIFK